MADKFETFSNFFPDWGGLYGAATGKGDQGFYGIFQGMRPNTGTPGVTPEEQALLDRNNALVSRENDAYGQQQRLANLLFQQATGQGPSIAGAQLAAGVEQANRNALSAAAGTSGNNGVLARYAAMQAAAQQAAAANQAAGVARVQETMGARQQLGQNLGTMAGQSVDLYGKNLDAYGRLRGVDTDLQKNNNEAKMKQLGSVLNMGGFLLGAA